MTNPQCIHIPDGSVVISGEVFDHFCGLGETITQLRGNLTLAEDGLASAMQEIELLLSRLEGSQAAAVVGERENERLQSSLERIQQAKLTWAMACHCECQACDTFYEAFRANAAEPVKVTNPCDDRYEARILLCRLQDLLNWVEVAARFKCLTDSEQIRVGQFAEQMRSIYGESRVIPRPAADPSTDPVQDPANAHVIAALAASPRPAVETDEAQVSEFVQCWLDSWGERWIPKAYVAAFILRLPPSEMTSTKTHDGAEDRAYYNGARAAAAMAHQSFKAMDKWIDSGCGNRVTALKSEVPVRHRFNHGGEIGKCLKCDQSPGAHPVKP